MNVCSYCGAADHSLNRCPWKDSTMKRSLAILALLSLTGCAGLSVNFDAAITYRSAVPAGGRADDAKPVLVVPPAMTKPS